MENKNKFFALNSDCFLVKGTTRGAIYNLKSGGIFSVDSISTKLIDLLEQGKSIQSSSKEVRVSLKEIKKYLLKIKNLGLGMFVASDYQRIKIDIRQPEKRLEFFHLEITEKCNLKCAHCYSGSSFNRNKKEAMGFDDYIRVLQEGRELDCERFQFIGGEPFLCRELIFELVPEAKKLGYKLIEIFSNGTLATDADLRKVKYNNLSLALSLYSLKPEIHDQVTQKTGSWDKTISTIKKAQTMEIPTRIAMIVMKYNENDIQQTVDFVQNQLGIKHVKVDYVRPSGRGCGVNLSSESICEKQRSHKPQFATISSEFFAKMKLGHNCFLDKICISPDGRVYPCVMERKVDYGSLKTQSLYDVLNSVTAKKFRGITKDSVKICQDCEYRYACFDCRVKARGLEQENLYAKPWWCGYNPYSGKWT